MLPRPDEPTLPPKPLRVLVVDNHPASAEALARHLDLFGHEPRTAGDGPAALEASRVHAPDVVLLALDLPGAMTGWQVAQTLQEQSARKRPLLIGVSGEPKKDVPPAPESPVDLHLPRPVDLGRLQKLLGRFHRIIS